MRLQLDPSTDDGVSAKMGIDATVPLGARQGKLGQPGEYERIRIPGVADLGQYLDPK